MSLNCSVVQAALSAKASGETVDISETDLNRHIDNCVECRDFADEISDIQRHFGG